MLATWMNSVDQAIDAQFEQMVALRRHLHARPEPSGEEYATSAHLAERLSQAGLRVRLGKDRRGVIAEPFEPATGPCIALRADIDALKIFDAKPDVPYRSAIPGVMHACGHDAHTATLVGVTLGLHAAAGALPWPVNWRLILQPAEETSVGALEMIEAGALEGAKAILAMHVDPSLEVGNVGVRTGPLTAACDDLTIAIRGRGGHAARPHESIDPIATAAQLISSLYLFVPRAVDSHDPVVLTIGQVIAGDNPNVIPEEVTLLGTLRTLGGPVREYTKDHIRKLARGIAEASGTAIQVDFSAALGPVRNDAHLTALLRQAGGELLGSEHVVEIPRPSMGGEDFAFYLDHVPGSMLRVGCRSAERGGPSLHSPLFDIDERAMAIGAKVLARAAVLWSEPKLHAARAT